MGIEEIGSSTAAFDRSGMAAPAGAGAGAAPAKTGQAAPPPGGGGPRVKGGGGAKAAASTGSASSASSSSAQIYDPADTNKDGVVSVQEALAYALKHPMQAAQKQAQVTSSQRQLGLSAYQQGQSGASATESSLLFSI